MSKNKRGKKIKKIIIPILAIILFIIPFAFARVCPFTETFTYIDPIENHGWIYAGGGRTPTDLYLEWDVGFGSIKRNSLLNYSDGDLSQTISFRLDRSTEGFLQYALRGEGGLAKPYDSFILMVSNKTFECSDCGAKPCIAYKNSTDENQLKCVTGISSNEWINLSYTIDLDSGNYVIYNDSNAEIVLISGVNSNISGVGSIVQLNLNPVINGEFNFDNIGCLGAFTSCEFPSLFCDTFDYTESMTTRDWWVYENSDTINSSFAPINNELNLMQNKFYAPYHETDVFSVDYRPDADGRFTRHYYAPVFSTEFNINISNTTDGGFKYAAYEKQYVPAWTIKAEVDAIGNISWFYINKTQPTVEWVALCENCSVANELLYMKITSFFEQRDNFPFNTSIDDDEIKVYANNVLLGTIENYLADNIEYISQYEVIKEADYKYVMDDYFVMVGTDRFTYTGTSYYTQLYENRTDEDLVFGEGTGDMALAISTIWDDMGLKSTASKIMAGLFLMFLMALIMFGAALSFHTNLNAGVLILVELFFMILLTYIKLLPIWLPFVVVLFAAGIGAAIMKMGTAN